MAREMNPGLLNVARAYTESAESMMHGGGATLILIGPASTTYDREALHGVEAS